MVRTDFWDNIPEDCQKAIKELNRLKVSKLIATDWEETFADVWWLVQHEVDLYAEGEFCQEASRCNWPDEAAMNFKNAQAAENWLIKWNDLFNKYKTEEYHSKEYFEHHTKYDDGSKYIYGRQVF